MPDWTAILNSPALGSALRIALVALMALLAHRALRLAAGRIERRLMNAVTHAEQLDRLKTLVQAGRGLGTIAVLIIAALMMLNALSVDIGPLLAGIGLAGLALSLGAQTLVWDFIGGALILIENQFTIGDVIKVGEASGSVERITLRATYLRDIEGKLHIVPNGDIRLVSNLTAEWARAIVDLNVDFQADMGRVMRALETAATRAQEDESIKTDLLEPPQALGWIGFKDWAVQMRLMAKTAPGKQWGVATTLRRCAVEALRAEGVRVAVPAQNVTVESAV